MQIGAKPVLVTQVVQQGIFQYVINSDFIYPYSSKSQGKRFQKAKSQNLGAPRRGPGRRIFDNALLLTQEAHLRPTSHDSALENGWGSSGEFLQRSIPVPCFSRPIPFFKPKSQIL